MTGPTPATAMPTMLDHALDYAANGWVVFPLAGKIPRTSRGHLDATTDRDVIRSWWTRWPAANIGGRVDRRLLVLDVDPRNGGDVQSLGPLPATLTCWSGRGDGGAHYYFLRPAGQLTSTRLPAGVDLKVNGYCVLPPSLHPDTGRPYRWVEHEVAALPTWLRTLLRPPAPAVIPAGARRRGNGRNLIEFVAAQPWGNVNCALFWAACRAVDDHLLDDLADDLVQAAVAAGHPEHSARRTVESAARKLAI